MTDEFGVIFRVNKGVFTLSERDSSEGETAAKAAVKENGAEQCALEPKGKFWFDGEFDGTPLPTTEDGR